MFVITYHSSSSTLGSPSLTCKPLSYLHYFQWEKGQFFSWLLYYMSLRNLLRLSHVSKIENRLESLHILCTCGPAPWHVIPVFIMCLGRAKRGKTGTISGISPSVPPSYTHVTSPYREKNEEIWKTIYEGTKYMKTTILCIYIVTC